MRFTEGYSTCQVCSPSRASILTGKYPVNHGITDYIGARVGLAWKRNDKILPSEYKRHLGHEETTLAEALAASGYKTFFAGKWHLGDKGSHPEDHGFQINKGGHRRGSPPGGFFSPHNNPKLSDGPAGESLPIRLAEETASFIKPRASSRKTKTSPSSPTSPSTPCTPPFKPHPHCGKNTATRHNAPHIREIGFWSIAPNPFAKFRTVRFTPA
jgi:arylsulfatase A-like enzyme